MMLNISNNHLGSKTLITYYFLGGLDTSEPWQGEWNGGVLVECVGRPDVPRRPAAAQPKRIPVAPKKTEDEG